jgi:hypothetical protein
MSTKKAIGIKGGMVQRVIDSWKQDITTIQNKSLTH